jgi:hypothetical protein
MSSRVWWVFLELVAARFAEGSGEIPRKTSE